MMHRINPDRRAQHYAQQQQVQRHNKSLENYLYQQHLQMQQKMLQQQSVVQQSYNVPHFKQIEELQAELDETKKKVNNLVNILTEALKSDGVLGQSEKIVEKTVVKGEKGDKGEKGEKGDKGEDGLPGKQGKDGLQGKQGKDGNNLVFQLPTLDVTEGELNVSLPTRFVTGNYQVDQEKDKVILLTGEDESTVTFPKPSDSNIGKMYQVINVNGAKYTIKCEGGTIDGEDEKASDEKYTSFGLFCDGKEYFMT